MRITKNKFLMKCNLIIIINYFLYFDSLATSSKSFIKANSHSDVGRQSIQHKKIDRLDSLRGSVSESFANETFGPLSNVRYLLDK